MNDEKALVIYHRMMEQDRFSAWLGLTLDYINSNGCKMHFFINKEMLNGFGTTHGGVLFAASDSVFAFTCNALGLINVALDANINFLKPAYEGNRLTVESRVVHRGRKTGVFEIETTNEKGELVCVFRGTSYKVKDQALED